jgi:hypothetical protein
MQIFEYLCQCFDDHIDPTQNSVAHHFGLTLSELKQHLIPLWREELLYPGSLIPKERVVIGVTKRDGKRRQRRITRISPRRVAREQAILSFIDAYISERRISPTLEQIAAAVGLRAKSNVKAYMDRLVEAGRLKRQGRAVWLPQATQEVTF